MKVKVFLLTALLVAGAACSIMEETVVSALLNNYVSAQEALAADDLGGARMALRALSEEVDGEFKVVVTEAASAEDLTAIRAKFKEISSEVVEWEVPEGYVIAYCPMADEGRGAPWVQKEGKIANPYFGENMLECGEIKKKEDLQGSKGDSS